MDPLQAAKKLYKLGYKNVIMVVGSDRVAEMSKLMSKYNVSADSPDLDKPGRYHFEELKVVSAGERDPDDEGVAGISGSKMRELVKDGKFNDFKKYLPSTADGHTAVELFKAIQKGLKLSDIKEETEEEMLAKRKREEQEKDRIENERERNKERLEKQREVQKDKLNKEKEKQEKEREKRQADQEKRKQENERKAERAREVIQKKDGNKLNVNEESNNPTTVKNIKTEQAAESILQSHSITWNKKESNKNGGTLFINKNKDVAMWFKDDSVLLIF
jgi:hypothetical protein